MVCITVSNPPNPSRVYMRLCKRGKRFLLLNWWVIFHVSKIKVLSNQMNTLGRTKVEIMKIITVLILLLK